MVIRRGQEIWVSSFTMMMIRDEAQDIMDELNHYAESDRPENFDQLIADLTFNRDWAAEVHKQLEQEGAEVHLVNIEVWRDIDQKLHKLSNELCEACDGDDHIVDRAFMEWYWEGGCEVGHGLDGETVMAAWDERYFK